MRIKNSILFVTPDYHCSFFYRDEFRKQGWKSDIFVGPFYPDNFLYDKSDIIRFPYIRLGGKFFEYTNHLIVFLFWLSMFWKYRVHLHYGPPPKLGLTNVVDRVLKFLRVVGEDFCLELSLAKLFGIKLIYVPTGCYDSDLQSTFRSFDDGNVCDNCGYFDRCDDEQNIKRFNVLRRYIHFSIGGDYKSSKELLEIPLKYKVIDLNLWKPHMLIPSDHLLSPTKNIRILHSSYLEGSGRTYDNRNIKGSPFVLSAIERLRSEGYPVEYMYIANKPSNQMRYYQAQADIVVEQLVYGWWGSTGVECMALGKPVICYLRPSWNKQFLKVFREYEEVPVISATTSTIYAELKLLVENEELRLKKGIESRNFAEKHFDPIINTRKFIDTIESIC